MSLIAFCAISIGLLWMLVAMYPSMAEKADDLALLVENYPESFLKAFGVEDQASIFSSFESFAGMENYSLMWPLVGIIMGIAYGGATIAGEVDSGTMELLLSLPLSRAKIFIAKYLSGLMMVAAFVVVTIFVSYPLAWLHGVSLSLGAHISITVIGGMFMIAVYSLAMMFSSFFSERGRASGILAGILVVMYALNIVASLKENLESLQYASFFHYYDYSAALNDHTIDPWYVTLFAAVALVSFGAGLWKFVKRDVAV